MQLFRVRLLGSFLGGLAWLGRQGARATTALVVLGIALPWFGPWFKPHIAEGVFVLLCLSFLRIDVAQVRGLLRRPGLLLAATAWTSFGLPLLFGLAGRWSGLSAGDPELFVALVLQGIAPPMMAAPAMVALMGLDATLVLVTMVASTALLPLSAPLFAWALLDQGLALSPLALGLKLLLVLGGSAAAGLLLRRAVGADAIERRRHAIGGLNILVLFIVVAAMMHGVGERLWHEPLRLLGLAALGLVVFGAIFGLTGWLFRGAGREASFVLALMASQRNLGLMLASTGALLPDAVWLYFAVSQFPIYLAPQLLRPLVSRLGLDRSALPGTA